MVFFLALTLCTIYGCVYCIASLEKVKCGIITISNRPYIRLGVFGLGDRFVYLIADCKTLI